MEIAVAAVRPAAAAEGGVGAPHGGGTTRSVFVVVVAPLIVLLVLTILTILGFKPSPLPE